MAPHSPLPWHQSHAECADGLYRTRVREESGAVIADIAWAPRPAVGGVVGTYREANAEMIVRAVNNHASVLAALKALRARAFRELADPEDVGEIAQADEAIANAE